MVTVEPDIGLQPPVAQSEHVFIHIIYAYANNHLHIHNLFFILSIFFKTEIFETSKLPNFSVVESPLALIDK